MLNDVAVAEEDRWLKSLELSASLDEQLVVDSIVG